MALFKLIISLLIYSQKSTRFSWKLVTPNPPFWNEIIPPELLVLPKNTSPEYKISFITTSAEYFWKYVHSIVLVQKSTIQENQGGGLPPLAPVLESSAYRISQIIPLKFIQQPLRIESEIHRSAKTNFKIRFCVDFGELNYFFETPYQLRHLIVKENLMTLQTSIWYRTTRFRSKNTENTDIGK